MIVERAQVPYHLTTCGVKVACSTIRGEMLSGDHITKFMASLDKKHEC